MLDTRLILVEGIPGSGKSTSAQWVALELGKRSIAADWFMDEHRGNPVNVWDANDADTFIQRTIENWERFVSGAQAAKSVVVLDGSLFSKVVHDLLLRDEDENRIVACLQAILHIAQPLNPALVMFTQRDLPRTLRQIFDQRGSEWESYMVGSLESSAYAQRRGLSGFNGVVQFYQHFMTIVEQVIRHSAINGRVIEDPARDWPTAQAKIIYFLSLPPADEAPLDLAYLRAFTGRYRDLDPDNPSPDPTCTVRLVWEALTLYEFRYARSKLIPVAPDTFEVQTLGYVLFFEREENGAVYQMRVGGKEPGVGIGDRTLMGRVYQRIGPV